MPQNIGTVVQIIGAVLDIKFPPEHLPNLLNAIEIEHEGKKLTVEVAQHIGDDTVRCIAMGSTDGLVRGLPAVDTGASIKVPVGRQTLGRIFNLLGEAVDNKPQPETEEKWEIHRPAPSFEELQSFSQFGSDLDKDTKERLAKGERIVEILKQGQNSPVAVENQVIIIYAVINNYLKDIPLEKVGDFERDLYKHMEEAHPDITASIREEKVLTPDNEEKLKAALKDFSEKYV